MKKQNPPQQCQTVIKLKKTLNTTRCYIVSTTRIFSDVCISAQFCWINNTSFVLLFIWGCTVFTLQDKRFSEQDNSYYVLRGKKHIQWLCAFNCLCSRPCPLTDLNWSTSLMEMGFSRHIWTLIPFTICTKGGQQVCFLGPSPQPMSTYDIFLYFLT